MVDIGTADPAVLVLTIKIGVSAAFAAFCRALPVKRENIPLVENPYLRHLFVIILVSWISCIAGP